MNSTSEICPRCELLSAKVTALEVELGRVREQLAAAKKNSATSSKPPSSDIVKPKPSQSSDGQSPSIRSKSRLLRRTSSRHAPDAVDPCDSTRRILESFSRSISKRHPLPSSS